MTQELLFEELRAEQDRLREQAGYLEQARARQGAAPARRRAPSRRPVVFALAAALSVAAAVAVWQLGSRGGAAEASFALGDGAERGTAGAFVAAPADRELPLRFADGTRVSLSAGSSARVASLDEHGAHLVIEKGRAVAAVVHRPGSRWRVDVGPFQVVVVGTRFDISWDASGRVLDLRLDEGAVLVSGGLLGESLKVQAGQRLRAFADNARVELSGGPAAAAPSVVVEPDAANAANAANAPESAGTTGRGAVPAAPTWAALAASGKFREALAAAEKAGFEAECQRASGSELLALGDAARLSGSPARAQQAYNAAHGKLRGGGRSSYSLGLVAFDQRGDFASAARYFETYLREQPGGSLRVEATGRLMESLQRSGRAADARRTAEQYLRSYPKGPQAALARQLVAAGN